MIVTELTCVAIYLLAFAKRLLAERVHKINI